MKLFGVALLVVALAGTAFHQPVSAAEASLLQAGWANPPPSARLRAYWWWLNGNVNEAAITRDLEQMKAKGFGGALICDADGASQNGNARVPHGPTFFSARWRDLFKHALREADRLGLEMSLNIQSGWNLGGPMVPASDAAKKLVWSQSTATGPGNFAQALPAPPHKDPYYLDLFVVALRTKPDAAPHAPIKNLAEKAMLKALSFSAPDTTPLLTDVPAQAGEEDAVVAEVLDLTSKLQQDGTLHWEIPEGAWQILRFGCTVGDHSKVSTSSEGWTGYALDVLDERAFQRYWDAVVEPLIADAGPLAGKTLRYLHTDSWEVEAINWTPTLREEFRQRRGYDLLPYLPIIAGRIVNSRAESNRFLADFRKTLGDLAVDHHYRPFAEWAHKHGMAIHPESGGPHAVPIDAQRCLGMADMPMSEFWAWSWTHRVGDANRFFVKQPASAAHTYGKPLVAAEGFTTIGPHWQETLWDNLKPAFDHACAEGMNRLVWHAFVCSPAEMGVPGQQYFAGTHLNPNVTWWEKSAPFFSYLNRCQFLLQQGFFVADACYYYGDHVPNFAQLRSSDPARLGAGYDYDVITEEAILTRLSVKDGRIVLPDGMSYALLVLPERTAISLPVLRRIKELVTAGATVVGTQPVEAAGLSGFPGTDAEVQKLAGDLWGKNTTNGRVISNKTARGVLLADGVSPDFEFSGGQKDTEIDWIHRRAGDTEIYFIANRSKRIEALQCTFRVTGKTAELWDAVSAQQRPAEGVVQENGRTSMPLELGACGSTFVIFRPTTAANGHPLGNNAPRFSPVVELPGPWQVAFDPKWGGPASASFEQLVSWTQRPEEAVRHYSGTATYTQAFDLPPGTRRDPKTELFIDLGDVRELAEVWLNGQSLGIVWAPPFRVSGGAGLKEKGNMLKVEVVNFWPNRIIGDQALPEKDRLTRTNVRKLTKATPLIDSGLLGPVRLLKRMEE